MSRKAPRIRFLADLAPGAERLDRVVGRALTGLGIVFSTREARQLVEAGMVTVDGRRADRPSQKLRGGERVEVDDPRPWREEAPKRVTLDEAAILHDDSFLIAVNKPSNLPTNETRNPDRDHLLAATARYLEERDGAPSPKLFAVHRLDAGTSGVVVMPKGREANAALAKAFSERRVQKAYDAVVFDEEQGLPDTFTVESYLKAQGRRSVAVRAGGRPSRTEFRVIRRAGPRALVEARPTTGRMHQIRVHLADRDAPILGDHLYGNRDAHAPRLMLHARRLVVPHPEDGRELVLTAATPQALIDAVG
ncbi:MAG: hypothetical protein DRJ42_28570 [Deltaproteobacteria bacterium]|nr:MAG: hypothetical protein DRJ42_28570 [Deltaproteobacteria bacterium]